MCSINDGVDIEDITSSMHLLKLKLQAFPEKCNKCKEEKPCIVLRNKDAYCKACFLASTLHKFKALLGKHRVVRDTDRVLIYHKGGHATTALLNFIKISLDSDTPKKLRLQPMSLFIEDQFSFTKSDRMHILKKVEDEMKTFNIPLYFTSLAKYENGCSENVFLTENLEEVIIYEKDDDLFATSETLTNDLRSIYKRRMLIDAAKKLNCRLVFTPEISTDIASQLLSNVALGRGSHIPLDSGFCDARDDQVTIIRPLRLFDIKELALHNYFNNFEPVTILERPKNTYKSVQNLIESFVRELQSNYPATVNTVLRTGDKLGMCNAKTGNVSSCYICKGPIAILSQSLASEEAIKFSHKISTESSQLKNENLLVTIGKDCDQKTCFSCSKIEPFLIIQE